MMDPRHPTAQERLDAELYELLHGGDRGDLTFYVAACEGAARTLELGCGGGRVLCALAAAGRDVTGVELHPGLVTLAREAIAGLPADARDRTRVVAGDMRALALPDRFDRVLIPHSALYLVGGMDAQRGVLRVAREHLAPGGSLALDVYAVAEAACRGGDAEDSGWGWVGALSRGDGRVVDVLERDVLTGAPCVVDVGYRFERVDDAGRRTRLSEQVARHHFFSRAALEDMLRSTGFDTIRVAGGFSGEPWDEEASDWLVVTARRSDGA